MFDIRFFKVSFSIRLVYPAANDWAETYIRNDITRSNP